MRSLVFADQSPRIGAERNRCAPVTHGAIQEFAIPTPQNDSYGITTGSDGNLWFTESKPYRIGRITPDGALTEFSLPRPPGASPFAVDIVTGPDGNLWFTVVGGAGRIGRITPQGKFSAFPLPSPNADPIGIVAGPDGALWFTEASANKIGRISTSGAITEFPVPTLQGNPIGITKGPDEALWFTEGRANMIGWITTSGVITEYYDLTPDMSAIEDSLAFPQFLLFLIAIVLGLMHLPLAVVDVTRQRWAQAAIRIALVIGPILVYLGTDGLLAHVLWWGPISDTDRFHILHHSAFAGIPLALGFGLLASTVWRPALLSETPALSREVILVSGIALVMRFAPVGIVAGVVDPILVGVIEVLGLLTLLVALVVRVTKGMRHRPVS